MRGHQRYLLAATLVAFAAASPQAVRAQSDQGFSTVVRPLVTGEEISAQDDLWALQVSLKPMRMVYVPVTNPRTGQKSSELVWYLVYKVVNRALPKRAEAPDSVPVNVEDAAPPAVFVPKATLVIEDPDIRRVIVDSIVPDALGVIMARERLDLKTSVQIAGELSKPQLANAKDEQTKYGVFMFRGVDPRTTAFSVYLSGFSSAYKIGKDASGNPMYLRRTIVIPYRRPADQFDQFEKEIRQQGDAKWIYMPDDAAGASK
jgi:hypothetical protein